jgi:hypothetical protein
MTVVENPVSAGKRPNEARELGVKYASRLDGDSRKEKSRSGERLFQIKLIKQHFIWLRG